MSLRKVSISIIILFSGIFISSAQTTQLANGVIGYWNTPDNTGKKTYDWDAHWIWLPETDASEVMLARKTFDLESVPSEVVLRITASSKYELYINGTYICTGPARSASHHQSFDILSVQKLLKSGKNCIAVRVHHQKEKKSYHLEGRAGLLVQMDFNSNRNPICSNANWKVQNDPSWIEPSTLISRFQMIVNDHVDLNKNIENWEQTDFDDTQWTNARSLLRNSGWPAPQKNSNAHALTTPWTSLVPRDIPYLTEKVVNPTAQLAHKVLKNHPITRPVSYDPNELNPNTSTKKKVLTNENRLILDPIASEETHFVLYDFGKIINGQPMLEIEGAKSTEIQILSAPYMVNNEFTHLIVDSNFSDKIHLSGKKDVWKALYFKPTRYIAIAVKGNSSPIKITSIGLHSFSYPFDFQGAISVPEAPWMEQIWQASMKTIDVCTTDAYTDNYRERRQYAQTGFYAALGNYYTFGDYNLQRRYLIQVAQEQEANGLMPAYAPLAKDDYMVILDSNCLWIRSLYNYFLFSGDEKTVRELLPSAKQLMSLLHTFTDKNGFIYNPPYAYWLDHTLNDRRGANFCLNGHYLGALKDFSKLLNWLNDDTSTIYSKRALKLTESLRNKLWDESKGLFADAYVNGGKSQQFSEHANAMALAERIATADQASKITNTLLKKDEHNFIKRANGMTMVSPAMSYFLHKGLAEYGFEQASLDLLHQRFGKMLNPDTNMTLWEEWWRNGTGRTGRFQERTRSDAQTESVFPPALIANYVLGIEFTKPGMREFIISKPSTTLTNFNGQIPSPNGTVKITWEFGRKNRITLEIPVGTVAKISLKSFNPKERINLKVNGKHILSKQLEKKYIQLNSGVHTITF